MYTKFPDFGSVLDQLLKEPSSYSAPLLSLTTIGAPATGVDEDGVGIGTTHMKRVFVKIGEHLDWSGQWPSFTGVGIQTGNYFGSYSWGKIILPSRSESNSYNAYTDGGVGGISTSMVVRRSAALKYKNFKTS